MQTQRYSLQREKIYQTVWEGGEHPTAEMVFNHLKPELPHLSLGTVYRNLHQMAEEGRLRELPGSTTRFDANVKPHAHFVCTICGAMGDAAELCEISWNRGGKGFLVEGYTLILRGICPHCGGTGMAQ